MKLSNSGLQAAPSQEETYEELHVHQVYEQIASHFSATRYKVRTAIFETKLLIPFANLVRI
jgi:hypothetical protein